VSLEVSGLACRGRAGYGLIDVGLSVPAGGACVLIGPNGAGKSLLLAVLAGLARPHAGRVRVAGFDLATRTAALRRAVGYTPQIPAAFAGLTVHEQLDFLARCRGLRGKERQESVATLLEVVGLAELSRVEATLLTPGQQRRLALAGALVHNPPVLLLDTALSGLDPAGRDELLEVLREVHALGATMLLASDRPAEALGLCTQALVLEGGRVAWQGSATEIPSDYVSAPEPRIAAPDRDAVPVAPSPSAAAAAELQEGWVA
jgi:ABC-type multidrug transport system ATPase subunit